MRCGGVKNIGLNELVNRGNSAPLAPIPIDSGLIFPFAGSVLVYGREQLLL
jgi:hypothetical protein